jgi:hypothetical protein
VPFVFYVVWMRYLLPHLQPSDETLKLNESAVRRNNRSISIFFAVVFALAPLSFTALFLLIGALVGLK